MRRAQGRLTPFRAGVLFILVTAIACYVAFGGRLPWERDFEVRAVVATGNELHSRTPVRIAGVEVGKVKRVEPGPGGTAIVTMALRDQALPLRRDARLKIRPRIFLEGNFFVDLEPGTPEAPELEHGGTIPLAQTAVPVQLDQILSDLQKSTREDLKNLLAAFRQSLDEGGAEALHRSLPHWAPALRHTAVALEALPGEREGDLAAFLRAGARSSAALASRRDELAELLTGLNTTLTGLADRREPLRRSLVELDALLVESPSAFDALNAAFPDTRALVAETRPALRVAPEPLRLANPLLIEVGRLISPAELPGLLRGVDPTVRSLVRLEPRLQRALELLTPVTECVRRNVLPTLKTPIEDPPLSTGRPVYQDFLAAFPGLASASQNFDGNGPAVRYHAGFGDQVVTFGRAPSTTEPLVGLTSEPLLGSRPRYTGRRPPFRPDVPCITQEPPDLRAETGPAPEQRGLTPAEREALVEGLRR